MNISRPPFNHSRSDSDVQAIGDNVLVTLVSEPNDRMKNIAYRVGTKSTRSIHTRHEMHIRMVPPHHNVIEHLVQERQPHPIERDANASANMRMLTKRRCRRSGRHPLCLSTASIRGVAIFVSSFAQSTGRVHDFPRARAAYHTRQKRGYKQMQHLLRDSPEPSMLTCSTVNMCCTAARIDLQVPLFAGFRSFANG